MGALHKTDIEVVRDSISKRPAIEGKYSPISGRTRLISNDLVLTCPEKD